MRYKNGSSTKVNSAKRYTACIQSARQTARKISMCNETRRMGEAGNHPTRPSLQKEKRAPARTRQTQPKTTMPEKTHSNATEPTGMETSRKIHQKQAQDQIFQAPNRRYRYSPEQKNPDEGKTRHTRETTHEYVDWVNGRPFHRDLIQVLYGDRRVAQIRNYIYNERRMGNETRSKYGLTGAIISIQENGKLGKLRKKPPGYKRKKAEKYATNLGLSQQATHNY